MYVYVKRIISVFRPTVTEMSNGEHEWFVSFACRQLSVKATTRSDILLH